MYPPTDLEQDLSLAADLDAAEAPDQLALDLSLAQDLEAASQVRPAPMSAHGVTDPASVHVTNPVARGANANGVTDPASVRVSTPTAGQSIGAATPGTALPPVTSGPLSNDDPPIAGIVSGVLDMFRNPQVMPPEAHVTPYGGKARDAHVMNAASQILENFGRASEGVVPIGMVAATVPTVVGIGASYAAANAAKAGVKEMGGSPEAQRLAADIAAAAVAGYATTKAAEGVAKIKQDYAIARGMMEPRQPQAPPRSVGRSATASARPRIGVEEEQLGLPAPGVPKPTAPAPDVPPPDLVPPESSGPAVSPQPEAAPIVVPTAQVVKDLHAARQRQDVDAEQTAIAELTRRGEAIPETTDSDMMASAFGSMGAGISDNLYRRFLERLQAGDPVHDPRMGPPPLAEQVVQRAWDTGQIHGLDDVRKFAGMTREEAVAHFAPPSSVVDRPLPTAAQVAQDAATRNPALQNLSDRVNGLATVNEVTNDTVPVAPSQAFEARGAEMRRNPALDVPTSTEDGARLKAIVQEATDRGMTSMESTYASALLERIEQGAISESDAWQDYTTRKAENDKVVDQLAGSLHADLLAAHVADARADVDTDPTDAQKESGNYRKGHVTLHGMDITIENPKGSMRSGVSKGGEPWSVEMPADYGYLKRSEGADGDHVDVYIGPSPASDKVWVIDQIDAETGKWDEHKAILGVDTKPEAVDIYERAFTDGNGFDRIGGITPLSVEEFKDWASNGDTSKPLSKLGVVDLGADHAQSTPAVEEVDTPDVIPTAESVAAPATTGPSVTYNRDRSSVEVSFPEKPDRAVLDKLKAAGFRWAKTTKTWYRNTKAGQMDISEYQRQIDNLLTQARSIVGVAESSAQAKPVETPKPAETALATVTPEVSDRWKHVTTEELLIGLDAARDERDAADVVKELRKRGLTDEQIMGDAPLHYVDAQVIDVTDANEETKPRTAPASKPNRQVAEYERMFGDDEAMGVRDSDEGSVFEDGTPAAVCTNCAMQVLKTLGRGVIVGFGEEDGEHNGPLVGKIAEGIGGHDFALIDDRYLIDPWIKNTEGALDRVAYDLNDPTDAAFVEEWYGPRSMWVELTEATSEALSESSLASDLAAVDAVGAESPEEEEADETQPAPPRGQDSESGVVGSGRPASPRPSGDAGAKPRPRRQDEPRPSPGDRPAGPVSTEREPERVESNDPALAPDLYRITDADNIGTGTVRERVSRNLAAIRIIKALEQEQRPATPEEQAALVKYVGWGGLSRVFEPWKNEQGEEEKAQYWASQHDALTNLLTDEEYATARNSTQNAHYTSPLVIRGIWDAVRRLGVKRGSAIEPSAGIGHFLGLTPEGLRGLAWAAIEKDALTAKILKALYPGAFVQHAPFESAALPPKHFTVAVGNVPFGNIPITDEGFNPPYLKRRIHNYFFAKTLDYVAPGGLVAFVTSHGTMDATDNTGQNVRKYLAGRADLLGAIRMPYTTFKGNAGTEVVTDVIFLRVRREGEEAKHASPWLDTVSVDLPNKHGEQFPQPVNQYFVANPQMVLGRHTSTGKMRAENQYNVEPTGVLEEQLAAAVSMLPRDVISTAPPKKALSAFESQIAAPGTRPFEYVIHEGRVGQVSPAGLVEPVQLSKDADARVRMMLPIRTALRSVYQIMAEAGSDADLTAAQATLTKAYDAFVKKHGHISDEKNWRAFYEDPDLPLLLSLEDVNAEKGTVAKTAIFTTRTKEAERRTLRAGSPQQALSVTMSETGAVDFDRIAELLGTSVEDAQEKLLAAHLVVDTPYGWQLPGTFLAGNVRVKLKEAQAAAKLDPRYNVAVALLEAVQPAPIPAHRIAVRLGVSWTPPEMVQEFVDSIAPGNKMKVSYTANDAAWGIEGTSSPSRFETSDVDTKTIILDALNDRRRVIKTVERTEAGTISKVDTKSTALVRQKKDDLNRAFANWLMADDADRRTWALTTYNDRFNAYVEPKIDGSYLTLPGMADHWRSLISPHQLDAIARVLQMGNTLLAHVVGAGKTLTMVAAMMEMKRTGLSRKPMLVVPNHLITQAPGQLLSYYPNAKIMVVTAEDLTAERRQRMVARIASGDWDAVIVPYSVFVRIPMSAEAETRYQNEIKEEIEHAIILAWQNSETSGKRGSRGQSRGQTPPSVKRLEAMRDRIDARLQKLANRPKDDLLTFEEIGVDSLFVDEAHSFKNLYFPTRQQAAGIPADNDSQRATDLYLKARHINELTHNRGIVLATGTPVSNSMAEVFVMQKLLQESDLARAGVTAFDAWLTQFGTITVETEFDSSGTGMKAKPRLKKFRNLPVLAAMFRQVADIKMIDDLPDLKKRRPKLRTGEIEPVKVPMTAGQEQLLKDLVDRAANLDPKDRRSDNNAKITMDGRLGFTDMRLLDRRIPEEKDSKIAAVSDKVAEIYKENSYRKGTQLVFLDVGVPGSEIPDKFKWTVDEEGNKIKRPLTVAELNRGFNLYEDLKKKLIRKGIPATEIAFIQDKKKVPEKKRDEWTKALFAKVQRGEIRVLLGSSETMGTGMNVQDRLVALHHVDPTWKPSEIEQRNGRILRQGNLFQKEDPDFEVRILSYLATGKGKGFGFDSYMWNLNQQKAETIFDFYHGDLATMANEQADLDLAQTVATAAGLKAIATGNPAIVELTKEEDNLRRLTDIKMGWEDSRREAEINIRWARETAETEIRTHERVNRTREVITPYEPGTTLTATVGGHEVEGYKDIGTALLDAVKQFTHETEATPAMVAMYDRPRKLGAIRGLDIWLERWSHSQEEPVLRLRHPQDKPRDYASWDTDKGDFHVADAGVLKTDSNGKGGMSWSDPTGLVTRINNKLDSLRTFAKATHGAEQVKKFESILAQPYEQQAELDAVQAKVDKLRKELGQSDNTVSQDVEEIDGGDDDGGGNGGTTLQMAVVPGAAEFGEHVLEPAAKKVAEMVRHDRHLLMTFLTPSRIGVAPLGGDVIRAHNAAHDQRVERARRVLEESRKVMDRWSHAQSLAFWDVMEGLEDVEALPPSQQPIVDLFKEIIQTWTTTLLDNDLLEDYIEHYFPHEWDFGTVEGNAIRRLFSKRPIQGRESYKRRRSIPTMREGIEAGLTPASWNPAVQLQRKIVEMSRSLNARAMREDMKEQGLYVYVPADRKRPEEIKDWVRVPEQALGTVYGPRVEEQHFGRVVAGYYYAPPEVVRLVDNYISPGLHGRSMIFDAYNALGNISTSFILGWSSFHLMLTGIESVISKQAAAVELTAQGRLGEAALMQSQVGPQGIVKDLLRGYKAIQEFYSHDADANDVTGIVGEIIQAGGGFGWSLFEHQNAPAKFMTDIRAFMGAASRNDKAAGLKHGAKAMVHGALAIWEAPTSVIMEHWVPYLKVSAFLDLAQIELGALPADASLMDKRAVLGKAWDAVDDRFGQLRYANLFWDNTFKQILMGGFLSVGWQVGSIRHGLGAIGQVPRAGRWVKRQLEAGGGGGRGGGKGLPPVASGEPPSRVPRPGDERLEQREFVWLLTMFIIVAIGSAIYQYLRSGKAPGELADGTIDIDMALRDLHAPRNGEVDGTGREERDQMISYLKDYRGWWQHPVTTLGHKLKPTLRTLFELFENEDFFGTAIYEGDDPYTAQLWDAMKYTINAHEPIGLQNAERRAGADATPLEVLKQWAKSQVSPFTPAPAEVERSDAEQYLHDLIPPAHRTKAEGEKGAGRRLVREKLRVGDMAGANTAARDAGLSQQSVKAIARGNRLGSLRSAYQSTTWQQAVKAMELSTPAERSVLLPQFLQKSAKAVRDARNPDARTQVIADRKRIMEMDQAPKGQS